MYMEVSRHYIFWCKKNSLSIVSSLTCGKSVLHDPMVVLPVTRSVGLWVCWFAMVPYVLTLTPLILLRFSSPRIQRCMAKARTVTSPSVPPSRFVAIPSSAEELRYTIIFKQAYRSVTAGGIVRGSTSCTVFQWRCRIAIVVSHLQTW